MRFLFCETYSLLLSYAGNYIITGRKLEGYECRYEFNRNKSLSSISGLLFSPRFPQNYKPNLTCAYRIHGLPEEQIRIVFTTIHLMSNMSKLVVLFHLV